MRMLPTAIDAQTKYFPAYISCLILVFFVSTVLANSTEYDPVELRNRLSVTLDSIELEKQIKKRQGEKLGDLELISKKLRDSINVLREELSGEIGIIPRAGKEIEKENSLVSFIQSLLKPAHVFDWIIIIVGFIALVSGFVLVLGLVHTFFAKIKKNKHPHNKKQKKNVLKGRLPDISFDASPPVIENKVGSEEKDLWRLRKRMRSDIEKPQPQNDELSPFSQPGKISVDNTKDKECDNSQRDKILASVREGLSVQEISRKYHISADSVALIVRVAGNRHSKS